jgi:DNA-binding transcriptional ArsR family regulator
LDILPLMTETRTPGASLEVADPAVLAALYDPVRYRIFRALEAPRTIAELAEAVGRPANRLYYHVRLLVEAGLVRQVGTRSSGRHTERVFGRSADRIRFTGDLGPGEGRGLLGAIAEELDDAIERVQGDSGEGMVSYHVVSLTPARAQEVERRLRALVDEFEPESIEAAGARRYGLLGAFVPLEREDGSDADP